MSAKFSLQPIGRFEFACFSYDDNHDFHLDDSSVKYYYTPQIGADLSKGFDTFEKLDDSVDSHLDSLLKTIAAHEQETGKKIDANIVTWRGMMTKVNFSFSPTSSRRTTYLSILEGLEKLTKIDNKKIMAAPFEKFDGFEMNATLYQGCIFIEENHAYKVNSRKNEDNGKPRRGPPLDVMQFWGYKFETLSTLPATWHEVSRDFIEGRETQVVNNKAQYCSVVRTGIGKPILCLGGEVDAIWDSKPTEKGAPINWVELKTSAEIRNQGDMEAFHRKLMKYWIQSFLLGVPKIIVGFRTRDGVLVDIKEIET
ncbi:Decapping nuclease RAI1, partial [Cladobotryum mycophilum]